MTLQELWKQYRDQVYPPDIPADQNRECHQAFMAGAFTALTEWLVISKENDDLEQAERKCAALLKEAEEFCKLRAVALNAGRN